MSKQRKVNFRYITVSLPQREQYLWASFKGGFTECQQDIAARCKQFPQHRFPLLPLWFGQDPHDGVHGIHHNKWLSTFQTILQLFADEGYKKAVCKKQPPLFKLSVSGLNPQCERQQNLLNVVLRSRARI